MNYWPLLYSVFRQMSANNLFAETTNIADKRLMQYCSLPWGQFNEVHTGLITRFVHYFCIINILITKTSRVVFVWNRLGIIENYLISSLQNYARRVLPFTASRNNAQLVPLLEVSPSNRPYFLRQRGAYFRDVLPTETSQKWVTASTREAGALLQLCSDWRIASLRCVRYSCLSMQRCIMLQFSYLGPLVCVLWPKRQTNACLLASVAIWCVVCMAHSLVCRFRHKKQD